MYPGRPTNFFKHISISSRIGLLAEDAPASFYLRRLLNGATGVQIELQR